MSDAYALMKLKPEVFPNTAVERASRYAYQDWQSKLKRDGTGYWAKLNEHFAEDAQFDLLRGMTVMGIATHDWHDVFRDVYSGNAPFQKLITEYRPGAPSGSWTFFASTLGLEGTKKIHHPALYPEWLFPYGYNQQLYLTDLARVWVNIPDDYYKLWDVTRLGEDSPEIARLRKIGQTARQEIDQVAEYSSQHTQH